MTSPLCHHLHAGVSFALWGVLRGPINLLLHSLWFIQPFWAPLTLPNIGLHLSHLTSPPLVPPQLPLSHLSPPSPSPSLPFLLTGKNLDLTAGHGFPTALHGWGGVCVGSPSAVFPPDTLSRHP